MKKYCVDIHVHPTLKPVYNQYPQAARNIWDDFLSESDVISNLVTQLPCLKAGMHFGTQCSLKQAAQGGVKILGISIFTYESGWTRLHPGKRGLFSRVSGLSSQKLGDIASSGFKIYEDTIMEYNYILEQCKEKYQLDGKDWAVKPLTKDIINKIKNGQLDIEGENTIYFFYSIEGIQSLGIRSAQNPSEDNEIFVDQKNRILERINEIRDKHAHWPQYITLCHHFGNQVAGHARTVPKQLSGLGIDQSIYLNKGISASGKEIIRTLLTKDKATRILVDIKHLSPQSRMDYYALLKAEYGKVTPEGREVFTVPIICSHTGIISNTEKLQELKDKQQDEFSFNDELLHNWSVNLCREDLEKIEDSEGLVGIQIDLKRLAGKAFLEIVKDAKGTADEIPVSCEIVWSNIFTAIAMLNIRTPNNKKAWDLFCIGSDYDGIVSYLPGFPTLSSYMTLKTEMVKSLKNMNFKHMDQLHVHNGTLTKDRIKALMFGMSAEDIADKIFSDNAVSFMAKNFVDKLVVMGK